jgi:hypothetical protein
MDKSGPRTQAKMNHKKKKSEGISCADVLDVLFGERLLL